MRLPGTSCSFVLFEMMFSCWVTLGSIPCSSTWQTFQGTEYYVHSVPMAWAQAKEFCQKMGGNLLMPKSSEENAFTNSLLQQRGVTTAWLNCRRYLLGWKCESSEYQNIAPGYGIFVRNCAIVKTTDGQWYAAPCDQETTAVCEREATVQQGNLAIHCMILGADGRPVTVGESIHNHALN
ncbi:snaclec B6-like [Patiria miniata]|uniref:C-type lectin domain-containing protein n=1 Tax=Patiria miniata TaxID=46514 RepID=A0A914ASK0_PATMI|nr:snaclec B6-like [Patiria miniata]